MASISLSMYSMTSIYVNNNETHSPTSYIHAHFHVLNQYRSNGRTHTKMTIVEWQGEDGVGLLFYLKNVCVCDLCGLKLFLKKNETKEKRRVSYRNSNV